MTLTKDDLKFSHMSKPYLFIVDIPNIISDYALLTAYIKETEMPGIGENEEKPKSWKLVFMNDEKQKLRISFIDWVMSQKKTFDTKIHQLNNIGQIIHTCSFKGLYPIGVSSLKLGHEFDISQFFSVYFLYDSVKMDFNISQPYENDI